MQPAILLLIPVENQVRELDPKLLLACIAAKRGFSSVIGSRRELEFRIDSYPKSIYLSKSMTRRSLIFFRMARKFGHHIVTWDEEALVHLPPGNLLLASPAPGGDSIGFTPICLGAGQCRALAAVRPFTAGYTDPQYR
jgi:hypothetical protein